MAFEHDVRAPGKVRRTLGPLFPDDGPIADHVALVASEFVSNVVQHTDDGGELRAWRDPRVRIEVQDRDPTPPTPRPADGRFGGRGLSIVEQLADSWGIDVRPEGKTVWAEFDPLPSE